MRRITSFRVIHVFIAPRLCAFFFLLIASNAYGNYVGLQMMTSKDYVFAGLDGTLDLLPSTSDYSLSVDVGLEFDSATFHADQNEKNRLLRQRRSSGINFGWEEDFSVNANLKYGTSPAEEYSNYGPGLSISYVLRHPGLKFQAEKQSQVCAKLNGAPNGKKLRPREPVPRVDCKLIYVTKLRFTLSVDQQQHVDTAESKRTVIHETNISALIKANVSINWTLKFGVNQYLYDKDIRGVMNYYDAVREEDVHESAFENAHGYLWNLNNRTFYGSVVYSPVTSMQFEGRVTNKYRAWNGLHFNSARLQATFVFADPFSVSFMMEKIVYPQRPNPTFMLTLAYAN